MKHNGVHKTQSAGSQGDTASRSEVSCVGVPVLGHPPAVSGYLQEAPLVLPSHHTQTNLPPASARPVARACTTYLDLRPPGAGEPSWWNTGPMRGHGWSAERSGLALDIAPRRHGTCVSEGRPRAQTRGCHRQTGGQTSLPPSPASQPDVPHATAATQRRQTEERLNVSPSETLKRSPLTRKGPLTM